MRIIAGEFRGRRLLSPRGTSTRPITDRVKQSLFDVLAGRPEGAMVYDLFAGTGSLGLEALSRGARHVSFFEADRSATALLRRNISALGCEARCAVVAADVFACLCRRGRSAPAERADLIFLDPPYRFLVERADDLRELARSLADAYLAPGGLIVFRHDARDELELPPLALVDRREYGRMAVELLTPAA